MKVLFTTNTPSSYRVDFFNELGKKCELTVLFETQHDKSRDKKWSSHNYKNFKAVFLKGIKKGEADAICLDVIKYINSSYDAIIIGAYHTPTARIAIEYMRIKHIPFIISSDGGFIKSENQFKYLIKKHYIGSASAWLSTGNATTEYLCHYGADKNKVWQYPFTSVLEKDVLAEPIRAEDKQKLRAELGIKEEKIFISVGQFIHRKGFDILINAAKDMERSYGFYIIGGTPTPDYLKLIEENNLSNVHFLSFMDKKSLGKYYMAADIFVLPTREDIWGLVVNEAMCYGLPVITTDRCVAGLEMVEKNQNGLIILVDSVKELRNAMLKLVTCDLEKMSQHALNTAKKYTIENMAGAHVKFLESWVKENAQ